MTRIIDADSHFMEPLDLWERYIDPKFSSRCLRFEQDLQNNRYTIVIEDFKNLSNLSKPSLCAHDIRNTLSIPYL